MSMRTLLLLLSFFQICYSNTNNKNNENHIKRIMFGSSYTPSSSKKTSTTTSKYIPNTYKIYKTSTYTYSPYYYHPLYVSYMFLFINYNNKLYIELHFIDITDTQYCPFNHCNIINSNTMNTSLHGSILLSEIIQSINKTQNATTLNHILLSNYGCSIQFDQCIVSGSSRSFQTIKLYITCICCFVITLFMNM